jgi:hypothetical protein
MTPRASRNGGLDPNLSGDPDLGLIVSHRLQREAVAVTGSDMEQD